NRGNLKAFAQQVELWLPAVRSASAGRYSIAVSSHEGRLTPARACRGEDGCQLARLAEHFSKQSIALHADHERPTLFRPLHRRLLGRFLRHTEVVRGVDQSDVRQRLREIAGLAASRC